MKENDIADYFIHNMVDVERQYLEIVDLKNVFMLRRRLNPHHPVEVQERETREFNEAIKQKTISKYVSFQKVKAFFIENREILVKLKCLDNSEDLLTYVSSMERIIDDDFENTFLTDTDD